MDISLVIPTINRSEFVIKMLHYLQDNGFTGYVLIGDSSEGKHLEDTRRCISALKGTFKVLHRHFPHKKNFECVQELLKEVHTRYMIFIPDDDLLVPGTLKEAEHFLDHHPEYSGVGGVAVLALLPEGAFGKVIGVEKYTVWPLEQKTGVQRLTNLLASYSVVQYSLYRTEQFKRRMIMEGYENLKDVAMAMELLPTCMLAVHGKVKMLDRLFVVRQLHKRRFLLSDKYDWLTHPYWQSSFMVFKDSLAKELAREDGLALEEAYAVIKHAFWQYLIKELDKHFRFFQKKKVSFSTRTKNSLETLIGKDSQAWSTLRKIKHITFSKGGLTLPTLLKKGSKYHADFMPAYRAIVEPPRDCCVFNGGGEVAITSRLE